MEILDTMDIYTPEKCKNLSRTHDMDALEALEALENETLESHANVRQ
jgi:hypothetical protein